MKSIIVTGGAGKSGSQICQLLKNKGYQPITFDNLSTGVGDRVQHGPLVKADVCETPRLIRTVNEYQPEVIIHCALIHDINASPEKVYTLNLTGTMSVLKAAQSTRTQQVYILKDKGLLPSCAENSYQMVQQIVADCNTAYSLNVEIIDQQTLIKKLGL